MDITLVAKCAGDATPPIDARPISVEAVYPRAIADPHGGAGENVQQSVRFGLDGSLQGRALLEEAASRGVLANVLADDGSWLLSRELTADDAGRAELVLTKADIATLMARKQAVPTDTTPLDCSRTVRLVPTGEVMPDFAKSRVMVSPVASLQAITATALDTMLRIVGDRISSLEVTGQDMQPLTRVAWSPAHLAVDGSFTFSCPQQASAGWLWWLAGDRHAVGFVPDDLSKPGAKSLAIALPALAAPPAATDRTPAISPVAGACACDDGVPRDVTEAEVANNPKIYTEDPGAFCRPFSNPERVLSEKSFTVIARVTQPDVGAAGSGRSKGVKLLDLDGDAPSTARGATGGVLNRVRGLFGGSRAVIPEFRLPVRHALPAAYADFVKGLPSGRTLMDAKHPLQWEDDIAQYQASTVALGHILEFRIRWRSNGYSLGTVAKTLTLAPRQAKRIQKVEWERSERAMRRERTQLTDVENDAVARERDYQDRVSASLNEWAMGASHADVAGVAGGIGFFAEAVLGGIGGGVGTANSASYQEGGRKTTASEHQRLRDAIRRHGDALRKFESTVVNEVTQEENVTGTTEVVRNLNYAHSLTVIYYQILRHLRVDSEFAGVRECLFVPFAIRPFDVQRAYRWREAIQASIRSPRFLRAIRHLKDVATGFATSDIPPGARAGQRLTFLRGSLYITMAVERPRDKDDGSFDPGPWTTIQHLLQDPARGIHSILAGLSSAEKDQAFQARHAQGVAANWANRLQLRIGTRDVRIDSTLATRYQFNRGVRIDFVVPPEQLGSLTRRDLQTVTVVPVDDLAPGSVANLTGLSLTYSTTRFERSVQARTGVNDLIAAVTGQRGAASVSVPLDAWELVDERLEIARGVQDLVEHLNEHVEYYHKAVWWHMDRDRLLMMLDGFYVPNSNNVSLATVVDREPLGIIGNCLVYRVGAASFLGYGKIATPEDLYNLYADRQPVRDPVLVSLPTDGLYAQTIMDDCLALEEHHGNLDWALNDRDPELGAIDPSLLASRRSEPGTAALPTPFPATIINLQNAPDAPAPSGLQGVLAAVTNPNAFRDMAGLAATQANAQAGLTAAAGLATNFGNQAAAIELAKLAKSQDATRSADQKLATIERARSKRLVKEDEAAAQAKEVLSAMNPDSPKGEAPHENAAINSAIHAAKAVPGSTIEANTGEGAVRLKLGGDVVLASTTGTSLPEAAGTGNLVGDATGPLDLSVAMKEYLDSLGAAKSGACVIVSLAYFTEAMKAKGVAVTSIATDNGAVELPSIANQAGTVLSARNLATLWFSRTSASNWLRLPARCRGAGAPGALLYADLVEGRTLLTSATGWPAGMTPGAHLQLWPSEADYQSVRDQAVEDMFGHSLVFQGYVPGDPTQITVCDQMGVGRQVRYPFLGLRYVIAANLGKAKVVTTI